MLQILQIVTLVLLAVTLALPLAHALELPGKLRLQRETYVAVQEIYYPGFTAGGLCEFLALLSSLALLFVTPQGMTFRFTLIAFVLLVIMHGMYWLLTHPVNKFWLKDTDLKGAGKTFFGVGNIRAGEDDWTVLRDRWEYSHVARATCALFSLLALVVAVVLD